LFASTNAQNPNPLNLFCTDTLTAVRVQTISRIRDLATELETSTDKDLEPVGNHLKDFCNRFTADQQTLPQPLEFLQALSQLSSELDWIKVNWKCRQLNKIAIDIAEMSEDFAACCLMDKQFVSKP
jgi:hypothetical protein